MLPVQQLPKPKPPTKWEQFAKMKGEYLVFFNVFLLELGSRFLSSGYINGLYFRDYKAKEEQTRMG
jgi:hypothetical protein